MFFKSRGSISVSIFMMWRTSNKYKLCPTKIIQWSFQINSNTMGFMIIIFISVGLWWSVLLLFLRSTNHMIGQHKNTHVLCYNPWQDSGEPQLSISFAQQKLFCEVFRSNTSFERFVHVRWVWSQKLRLDNCGQEKTLRRIWKDTGRQD